MKTWVAFLTRFRSFLEKTTAMPEDMIVIESYAHIRDVRYHTGGFTLQNALNSSAEPRPRFLNEQEMHFQYSGFTVCKDKVPIPYMKRDFSDRTLVSPLPINPNERIYSFLLRKELNQSTDVKDWLRQANQVLRGFPAKWIAFLGLDRIQRPYGAGNWLYVVYALSRAAGQERWLISQDPIYTSSSDEHSFAVMDDFNIWTNKLWTNEIDLPSPIEYRILEFSFVSDSICAVDILLDESNPSGNEEQKKV